ncbi:DUF724 domain-containing protein 5-like [Papaver somniferum]|uniref:DUF724 domain-containing protein 5-like n=1 Tax=Papaver somniferum TaxID=3469 RepID=UPI000E7038F3|nr:DUF724 domain-containing protein 5-like [Papaver somniferum]
MTFPLIYHRSSSLSHELRLLYDQIFTALPQTPHFNPLGNLSSDNFKEGIKLGYDISFINLVMKFGDFVDLNTFLLSDVESYTKEFKEFEEMGYDVSKLRNRFNQLNIKAEQDKELKNAMEKLEEEDKHRKAKIESQQHVYGNYSKRLKGSRGNKNPEIRD